ncbi:TonB-dependent siderophore receptor [Enterovirga sp. GCM10030262]|uniref:TonB-dependent siderophore receptor n=1 Tax=Enterovirga sp. GCM10030262 TaxID=3273391 RepID=UPI00361EB4DB
MQFRFVTLMLLGAATSALAQPAADEASEDIVVTAGRAVTATKTETPIIETPQAISVVPAELFLDRGARNVQETLRYSAGVTAEAFGLDTRSDTISVRGLDPVQYQDGMRKNYNFSPIPRIDVHTLDRVEVLRGPSSVLYGQGASGGIVNIVSKRPLFETEGEVAVEYGSFDRKQARIDVTGPLDEAGILAGRLVAVVRDANQQTDRIGDDRIGVSPSLTWNIGDHTTLTAIGLYQRDRSASSQQFLPVVATLAAPPGRRVDIDTFLGDEDYDRLNARQFTGTLLAEHRFSDAVTSRSRLRFVDAKTTFQEIFPDVYSNPLDPFIDDEDRVVNRDAYQIKPRIRVFTNDNNLELDFATGPFTHKLLVGVDYSDFRQRSRSGFGRVTPIDIYDPVSAGVVSPDYFDDPRQRNTQLGIYVQDQIRYADRVTLVVGARRDRARSKTEGSAGQVDQATTFRAGLIGEIGWGVAPYVSYSESFLPVAGLDFNNVAFVPVRGRQYEAGVKWQPARGALLTASVYDIVESNRPTNDPENVLNTVQTGEIRSRGFELEGAWAVADDFLVTAAYSHTDAEVTKSNFAPEVGQRLSDVPRDLASLWGMKSFAIGGDSELRLGGGVRHVGATVSTGVAGALRTPSYTLVDALAEFDWRQWTVSLSATNLFDETYYAPCRAFGDCFTGNKRSVIGTLAYRF